MNINLNLILIPKLCGKKLVATIINPKTYNKIGN